MGIIREDDAGEIGIDDNAIPAAFEKPAFEKNLGCPPGCSG